MPVRHPGESGQAAVEFALIAIAFMMLTVGLVDAGQAFYQYNGVASAARFAARWASVEGGTCGLVNSQVTSENDWCNQFGGTTSKFWSQNGNIPLQSGGTNCPTDITSGFSGYYSDSNSTSTQKVSTYAGTPTVIGAVLQHLDTNSSGTLNKGGLIPDFSTTKLKVCIQLTWDSSTSTWSAKPGDVVNVYVYYPYSLITNFLPGSTFNLTASGHYVIE